MLRLINEVIDAGHAVGVPVSMCGEMAGDPRFVPLLLGMGLREFSMQPTALLDVREQLSMLDTAQLTRAANDVFRHLDFTDPLELFEDLIRKH